MKKVKIITIILGIVLITLIAFGGLYIKTQNRMENKIKDYALSRELKGGRVIELKVSKGDGDTSNSENLTEENYEIVKKTIEKRLNYLGAEDYNISLNREDGTIRVELADNDNTDTYAYYLTATGEVQMKEKDAETVLLSDSMVKEAVYTYTSNIEGAYQVYLELQLTEEGQAKIGEIQNNYAVLSNEIEEIESAAEETEEGEEGEEVAEGEETTEGTEDENAEEAKKIAKLTIAGTEYDIDKIEKNKIRTIIGTESTDTISVNNNLAIAAELAMLINSGKYPVQYEIEDNRFEYTNITEEQMIYFLIVIAIVLVIAFIVFTVKYKINGLLASVSYIGFIAILSLILRYTNVNISIEGIGAIILTLILNLRINQLILEKTKIDNNVNEAIISTYKDVFLKIIPIIIITLVFCFAGWSNLSSFGMIMFWGLLLIVVYNVLITETLLKLRESK